MIGIWTSSGSGTSSMSTAAGRAATTRCALYDGSRSTRHCGPPVLVPAAHQVGRVVLADEPGDHVQQPAHGVDRRAVRSRDLRDAEEGPEVHRGGVEEHQPSLAGLRRGHARHLVRTGSRLLAVTPSDLEPTDRKILELLATDGRMSFTDLGQGHRPLHVRRAPARQAPRAARSDPRLRRHGQPRRDRAAADGVHLDPPHRPVPAGRLARAAARHPRDRVLLVGRRGGVLHPQGPPGHARATSRSCSPGSGRPPTSPPAPRSCSRPTTRTGPSPEGDGPADSWPRRRDRRSWGQPPILRPR